MVNMRMTKKERDRDQLGEKLFEGIYSVIADNGLNIDPLADECGDDINNLVEILLNCSKRNEE